MSPHWKKTNQIDFIRFNKVQSLNIETMMLLRSLTLTFLTLATLNAYGLQKQEVFTVLSPKKAAEVSDKTPGLKTSALEKRIKNGLIFSRINKPAEFFKIKNNTVENPPLYQSYVDEVNEAFFNKNMKPETRKVDYYKLYMESAPVEMARKIAKLKLLQTVEKNWLKLKDTIFNDYSVEDKNAAKALTIEKMKENFIYLPDIKHQRFLFKFFDSFVEISKDLKTGRVALDIDSRLDTNTLSPDADNIIADDASPEVRAAKRAKMEEQRAKNSETNKSHNSPSNEAFPSAPTTNTPSTMDNSFDSFFGDEKL